MLSLVRQSIGMERQILENLYLQELTFTKLRLEIILKHER